MKLYQGKTNLLQFANAEEASQVRVGSDCKFVSGNDGGSEISDSIFRGAV